MKKIIYVVIPVVAFVLIFVNAFFGHLIFSSPDGYDINKYSIYVHLQSNWNSYPGNILFDVTNVWPNSNWKSDAGGSATNPSDISSLTSYNSNQLQHQHDKTYVELKHEFSNCETNWSPSVYRYAVDIIRNKIEILQGIELDDRPYVSRFPNELNLNYDMAHHKNLLKNGYVQFIPICTLSQDTTSYDYAVLLNDKNIAFDVYFVTSKDEVANYLNSDTFEFYQQDGCVGENYHSYSGTCNNVGPDSGLMIVLPDNFEQSLTKLKVSLYDKLKLDDID